jgi:hypothetical protein
MHAGYGPGEGEYDEGYGDEDDRPRGRRGLLVIVALVGAIGLGGGLAYAYKMFGGTGASGRAPMVRADAGPNKTKPAVPGGKEFAHTDKKLLNRLGDDAGAQDDGTSAGPGETAEREDGDPNAPRRVRVIPVTPGAPLPQMGPPGPAAGPGVTAKGQTAVNPLPGITLDNVGGPPPRPPVAPRPGAVPAAPPMMAPANPQPPVKLAAAPVNVPPPAAEPPAAPKKAAAAAPARPVAPKPKEPAGQQTATASSGYVAVLSSQKSRMDALKVFADLQQKYSDVLSSKTPDVQEADLGEKGVWYRAVVGPPGSREAAFNVCSQLKSAGYTGCWVTAY